VHFEAETIAPFVTLATLVILLHILAVYNGEKLAPFSVSKN